MPAQDQAPPLIYLTLGDEYQTIKDRSTYRFPTRALGGIDIIAASEPVILHYARPGCEFVLPPARSFSAAVDDGHAVSVTVSPQLEYISLPDALKLAQGIGATLAQSKWRLFKQYRSLAQTQAMFSDPNQNSDLTVRTEDWRCGEDEVSIDVERQWRSGESLPTAAKKDFDFMVVTLKINNDRVRAQYPGH